MQCTNGEWKSIGIMNELICSCMLSNLAFEWKKADIREIKSHDYVKRQFLPRDQVTKFSPKLSFTVYYFY